MGEKNESLSWVACGSDRSEGGGGGGGGSGEGSGVLGEERVGCDM